MTSKKSSRPGREKLEIESHGGYMAEKIRKLDNQFHSDIQTNKEKARTSSNIFEGVSIHVNGYTDPSSDELKRLMMLHGGRYQHYYSLTKVTHIIATNLPYTKIRQLRNEKIVKPEWITDSIKVGSLLPSRPYELYADRSSGNQSTLNFFKKSESTRGKDNLPPPGSHICSEEKYTAKGQKTKCEETASRTTGSADGQVLNKSVTCPQEHGPASRPVTISTAGDPKFLSEFYSNSRLHHISTWGAECKAYVTELQSKSEQTFPGKQRFLELIEERRSCERDPNGLPMENDWQDTLGESQDSIRGYTPADTGGQGSGEKERGDCTGLGLGGRVKGDAASKAGHVIMHIDMDCFFVSVGLTNHPELVGKPVAVTHSKGQVGMSNARQEIREIEQAYYEKKYGSDSHTKSVETRTDHLKEQTSAGNGHVKEQVESIMNEYKAVATGQSAGIPSVVSSLGRAGSGKTPKESFHSMSEIASCNYEARKFGVKNGMFMGKAKTLCPELQTIPYDFEGYKRVSQMLYDIVASYTHEIEAVSCDEMFVDITGILEEAGASPVEFTEFLRAEIRNKTGCNASCGMASNILLARMATRKAKPNGQFFLESQAVNDFIKLQPVKDLPGVGRSMVNKLEGLTIRTCGDLQVLSQGALQKEFGPKTGLSLYRFCRGVDDRPIRQEQERKSVSAEVNYGIRFKQDSDSDKFITELAAEVHKRLTAIKMQARTFTVKLKVRHPDAPKETSKFMGHGICEDKAKSTTVGQATDNLHIIQRECKKLLKELQVPAVDMRGVGIQLSKLSSRHQPGTAGTSTTSKSITAFMTSRSKTAGEPRSDEQLGLMDKSNSTVSSFSADTSKSASGSSVKEHQETDKTSRIKQDSVTKSSFEMTHSTSNPSTPVKQGARTMLNFVSKKPSSVTQERSNENGYHDNQMDSDAPTTVTTPAKKKRRELPPLPFLPSTSSPQPEQRPSQLSNELALPSPSQLDMSVLSALPEDIQQQILQNYTGNINKVEDPNKPSTSAGTAFKQSNQGILPIIPPHLLEDEEDSQDGRHGYEYEDDDDDGGGGGDGGVVVRALGRGKDSTSFGVVEALPSFSQIDTSCLEALPPELQEELRLAYRDQAAASRDRVEETRSNQPSQEQVHGLASRSGPSPAKKETRPKASPTKSPFKIRKRGRPRKGSPRSKANNAKRPRGQIGIQELITRNQTPPKHLPLGGMAYEKGSSPSNSNEGKYHSNQGYYHGSSNQGQHHDAGTLRDGEDGDSGMEVKEDEGKQREEEGPVNLCGAVQLWDVKTLLRDWISSTDDPEEEDVGFIVQYLRELILDKNLEMVDLVIRSFKRLTVRRACPSWLDAHVTVVARIQHTLEQIYGAQLKLS